MENLAEIKNYVNIGLTTEKVNTANLYTSKDHEEIIEDLKSFRI